MAEALETKPVAAAAAANGADSFDVVNPATGQVFATAPECSEAQLDEAFAAAELALRTWRRDDAARAAALKAAGKAVLGAMDEIVPVLIAEQGKPRSEAIDEVKGVAGWLFYYAKLEVPRQVIQDDERGPGRGGPQADRGGRRDHAVELPAPAGRLEDRPGAARGEHDGAEAVPLHAALVAEARARCSARPCRPASSTSSPAATTSAR